MNISSLPLHAKRALFPAVLSLSLAVAPAAHADLESALESMLGANVQVNSGAVLTTSRRGGIYGGSVYVRGKVMNVNVLNFTPPSFASGCGGMDIFAGSFSMINAEQFVTLLRSIAQNAVGYAFHLALKNICEQCSTIVAGLQRAVQEMNQFTGNSCQLAKGVVNSGIQALQLSDVKGMQGDTIQAGFNDAFEAFWGDLSSSIDAINTVGSDGKNTYKDKYEVNVVWSAMQASSMAGWFGPAGDADLLEALMSLTGTIVLTGPVDDADGNPSRNVTPVTSGGYLQVRDLIYGSEQATFLECDDADKCLSMSTTATGLKGVLEVLKEDYLGTGPSDTSTVLYQIVNGTGGSDDAAEKLIGQFGHVGSMIIDLATTVPRGSDVPYEFFSENAEYIAYELVRRFVTEATAQVEQAIHAKDFPTAFAEDWRRNEFKTAVERIGRDLDAVGETMPSSIEMIQGYVEIYRHMVITANPLE